MLEWGEANKLYKKKLIELEMTGANLGSKKKKLSEARSKLKATLKIANSSRDPESFSGKIESQKKKIRDLELEIFPLQEKVDFLRDELNIRINLDKPKPGNLRVYKERSPEIFELSPKEKDVQALEQKAVVRNGMLKARSEREIRYREIETVNRLQKQVGGIREFRNPAGAIDLLTDVEVIECKEVNNWKAAFGQVLAYHACLPSGKYSMRIHLFGETTPGLKATILQICGKYNVRVTWDI